MADKKLNDLAQIPSIGSLKNIYVEDANGNQYKVSKESLAEVLGGLLPVATAEKNGLMSAKDRKSFPSIYENGDRYLYKIASNVSLYARSYAYISGSYEGNPFMIIIGFFGRTDDITVNLVGLGNRPSVLKLYRKDRDIYLFMDHPATQPSIISIQSSKEVTRVSTGIIPDSSYKEILT